MIMLVLISVAVVVLPIQLWTDAMPKFSGGINFQNVITLLLLIGWKLSTAREGRPMVAKNELNRWLGAYLLLTFVALYYGVLWSPVGPPLSISDERFIHWKDEATGIFMFFLVANCIRSEKHLKWLLVIMLSTMPYIIKVYYDQYHSTTVPKTEELQADEVVEDDELGSLTGAAFAPHIRIEESPLIDDDHELTVTDSDGNDVVFAAYSGNKTIRIYGWNPKSDKTLTVHYYQDQGAGGAAGASTFSWALKDLKGVFTQVGSNEMAAFYANVALMILGVLVCVRGVGWWAYLLLNLAFLGWGIIFSLSRGAWLAICAGIGYLGARKSKAIMAVFILFLAVAPTLVGGAVSGRASGGMDDSAASRLDFWKWAAVAGTIRYPTGVGYQCYIPKHEEETGIKLDTHNFFFRTLAEMGLLGLTLVFLLFRGAFRNGWKAYQKGKTGFARGVGLGAAILVIGSAVSNMFGDRFSYVSLGCYLWAFVGMAAAVNNIQAEQDERETEDLARKARAIASANAAAASAAAASAAAYLPSSQ